MTDTKLASDSDTTAPYPDFKTAYEQLCRSYHEIDGFRTKLLGFLPLASGAGLLILVEEQEKLNLIQPFVAGIGLFGFVVTLGLFLFEIYGIAKCAALISTGIDLEVSMKVEHCGQFSLRPQALAGFINEPFASGVIYPAVLAAWTYVGLHSYYPAMAWHWSAGVFVAGMALVGVLEFTLRRAEKRKRKALAKAPLYGFNQ